MIGILGRPSLLLTSDFSNISKTTRPIKAKLQKVVQVKPHTYTLKKSYKRPPHSFSSSSESKIRSIKIHDHMNKPMSNSGSVSFCIPKCVILLTQTKHV